MNNALLQLHHETDGGSYSSNPYWYGVKEAAVSKYAWAVPNDHAIQALVLHSPIVEIGAGTGYWARMVSIAGGYIVAYDKKVRKPAYFDVQLGGPEKILLHQDQTLFLCWPPYATSLAADCLKVYTGKTVIYVGEGDGGCTGDDAFHTALEREWEEVVRIFIPQWVGIHDRMYVYKRKGERK